MKKLLSILLTIFLITGFTGCYNCNDKPYFNINKMDIQAFAENKNMDPGLPLTPNTGVAYDSLILHIGFSGRFHAIETKQRFSFLPAAVASDDCEPDGYSGSKESIENISVIALSDFDNEFKAGDILNPIITISNFPPDENYSIPEINLNQFLSQQGQGVPATGYYLYLNRKPAKQTVQFRVDVNLTNGEKYSGETIPITIK